MAQSLKTVGVITLFVEDQQRSKEFYERVFEVAPVDEEEGTVTVPGACATRRSATRTATSG